MKKWQGDQHYLHFKPLESIKGEHPSIRTKYEFSGSLQAVFNFLIGDNGDIVEVKSLFSEALPAVDATLGPSNSIWN